jgi:hypothetical protein
LLVNGAIVSTHTASTVEQGYTYSSYTSGDFGVEFINDSGNTNDLYVDNIEIDGTVYQEGIATHSNPSCNSGENLWCNGSITWHDGDLVNCSSTITPPPAPICAAGSFVWDNNIQISGCNVSGDWNTNPCCNWNYTIPGPLPAGMTSGAVTIDITDAVAWDGYCNRNNAGTQNNERYEVQFYKNGSLIWTSDETGVSSSDDGVADGVLSAFWRGPLGGFTAQNGVDEIRLVGGGNSVYPTSVCIAYSPVTTTPDFATNCGDGQTIEILGAGSDFCSNTPDISLNIPNSNNGSRNISPCGCGW